MIASTLAGRQPAAGFGLLLHRPKHDAFAGVSLPSLLESCQVYQIAQFKEFELKSPRTGPHGLAEDREGNIWFTGNSSGVIGRLDPKTGNVTEHKMPDPAVRDPHTLNFDQSGMLWFTAQNANVMGRLDPRTGEIKIIKSPTANSRPYGLHINSKGVPVVVLFGTNKIATIDPITLE